MNLFFTLAEIDQAALRFWETVGEQRVFAFQGPLGAGKTTFIAALCRAKGVQDEPSSPTFSLINAYVLKPADDRIEQAYHLDLYRIRDEEEALQAGIEDCLLTGAYCFVEWPEKIPDLLPDSTLYLRLTVEQHGRRLQTQPAPSGPPENPSG